MKLREIKSPRHAAGKVLNSAIDIVAEVIEGNKKLADRFQPLKDIPKFDVQKMVEDVKTLAAEYYAERRQAEGDEWFGNLEEWQFEAVRTLKDDLCTYARKTNDEDLWQQIHEVWPEKRPPRDLTKEELSQLVKLQEQANDLFVNLETTVLDAMEELISILQSEVEIVKGTSGHRLLLLQSNEFIQYMTAITKNKWLYFKGATTTPPEHFQMQARDHIFKTRKWGK